jgi:hypothetical protein
VIDPSAIVFTGQWIVCIREPQNPKKKTATYLVITQDLEATIAEIRWYGPWRKYALFPAKNTVFEATCLRELALVCTELTTQYRRTQPKKATVTV